MKRHISIIILLFIIAFFFFRQKGGEQDEFHDDYQLINQSILHFNTPESIDSLIDFGLYNLAFEAILRNKKNMSDSAKISIAFKFAENGEFDKGYELIGLIDKVKNRIQFFNFSLYCNLKKENRYESKQLFDSLEKYNSGNSNIQNKVELLLSQAYLEHNRKNYQKSISLNESAIVLIQEYKLPEKFLAIAYRRLGNDYNDIIRNKIKFPISPSTCLQHGFSYYKKELEILLKEEKPNKTTIALNYITTAMLNNSFLAKEQLIRYYKKALELLIVSKRNKFIVTRNPIYTSLALTNLGDIYLSLGDNKQMTAFYDMNKNILDTRSFYKVNNKQSLDFWVYFRQIGNERKIEYELKNNSNNYNAAKNILNLSTNCKYNNQYLSENIEKEFGNSSSIAIKNWILFNELLVFANQQKKLKNELIYASKIKKYNSSIDALIHKKNILVDAVAIKKIRSWCKTNDATIIDYQIIFGGGMTIITMDKNGISLDFKAKKQLVSKSEIKSLKTSMYTDDIVTFQKKSFDIYQKLSLYGIKTKNIIICPDEYLEKIPFDVLISKQSNFRQWSDINYLGKTKHISLIPNLSSLLLTANQKSRLKIDIWSSKSDNVTLPYNLELIQTLEENFSVSKNNRTPKHILHVLAHTYRSQDNNIEFRLDSDTLSIDSNGSISPKLAILAGCSSGEGKIYKFEGAISQTRCFLYNGTSAVIYSIWDADNQSTSELFKLFYSYLDKGISASLALSKAKKDLINTRMHPEWANPFYWANFQYTGTDLSFFQ